MSQPFPKEDGRQIHVIPWEAPAVHLNSKAHRDAQCAETMKLWAHHIPLSVKNTLQISLPTLPTLDFRMLVPDVPTLRDELTLMNKSLSCVAGHTVVDANEAVADLYKTDWPHWPVMTHFRAKGHGPYPFWQFGPPPSDWILNTSFNTPYLYAPGNTMEVWHNTLLKATKILPLVMHVGMVGLP